MSIRFSCFLDGINLGSKLLVVGCLLFLYNWLIGERFLDLLNSIGGA